MGYDYTTHSTPFNQSGFNDTRRPVYYGLPITISMVSVALVASIITITGNVIVLISFILEKSIRQPSNYFIASLAVSDLLIGAISIPFYAAYLLAGHYWLLGELLCDLWLSIDYSACLCSIYTVFCITIDRYCSVKIPAKYRAWKTGKKILLIIAVIWTIPVTVFFTSIFGWQYFTGKRDLEVGECDVQYMKNAVFNSVLQIGYFWVTLFFMIALYANIYRVVLRLQRKSEKKRKKIARLVATASSAKPLKPQSSMLTGDPSRRESPKDRSIKSEHLSLCRIHSPYEMFDEQNIEVSQCNDEANETLLNNSKSTYEKKHEDKCVSFNEKEILKINSHSKSNEGEGKKEAEKCKDNENRNMDQPQEAAKTHLPEELCAAKKCTFEKPALCMNQQSHNTSLAGANMEYIGKPARCEGIGTELENEVKEEGKQIKVIRAEGGEQEKESFSKSHTTETFLNASLAEESTHLHPENCKTDKNNEEPKCARTDKTDNEDIANKYAYPSSKRFNKFDALSEESNIMTSGPQTLFLKKKSILLHERESSVNTENNPEMTDGISESQKKPNSGFSEKNSKRDHAKNSEKQEVTSPQISFQETCRKLLKNRYCCCEAACRKGQQPPVAEGTNTASDNDHKKSSAKQPSRREDRAFKALRTITLILGAFVLCWTPWHLLSFVMGFCPSCVNSILYDISYWVCYTNSPINPLCYAFANYQFKKTFIRIVRLDWQKT